MKYAISFLAFCGCLVLLNSCKKGCTNPKALNYNHTAREDDASCLFCDSVVIDQYIGFVQVRDNNSQSQHYQDYVLHCNMRGTLENYSGNNCALLGYTKQCNSQNGLSNFAYIQVDFENMTPDTLVVSGSFEFNVAGATAYVTRQENGLTIPPYGKVNMGETLFFDCIQASYASSSVYPTDAQFQYK